MRASSKCLRVEPSSVTPPTPSFVGATSAEASVDAAAATAVPPPSTSDDSDI